VKGLTKIMSSQKEYSLGFTIIETMIYLAVAGVVFFMTITILGVQQRTTQFNQATREFESVLNDISNDTATGVFPDIAQYRIRCNKDNSDPAIESNPVISQLQSTAEAKSTGENFDCVNVGKAVLLRDEDDNARIQTVTLIGANNANASDFSELNPIALRQVGGGVSSVIAEPTIIPWNTTIDSVQYVPSNGDPVEDIYGVVYMFSEFSTFSDGTTVSSSGDASISLYAITTNGVDDAVNVEQFADRLNVPDNGAVAYQPVQGIVRVCVSGPGDKRTAINIGSASGSITAQVSSEGEDGC